MKIVKLSSKNVKRLRAVEVEPDGNTVVVGGRNGQGKTSLLDSIMYALAGKDTICSEPVRRGAKKAEVVCDLGEIIVRRTFSPDGGGSLTLENRDGARFASPQSRLDDLVGLLSFDPLAFARMDSGKQAETLRRIVGLDFSALDRERAETFDLRTDVNREGKALRARYDALPDLYDDAPADEQSAEMLLAELAAAQDANTLRGNLMHDARRADDETKAKFGDVEQWSKEIGRLEAEIAALQSRIQAAESKRGAARDAHHAASIHADALHAKADAAALVDVAPISSRLAGLEEANRRVRENKANAGLSAELDAKRAESERLSARLAEIDAKKQATIAAAAFPVDGLGFGPDGGVTLRDLPFDQASSAEQLRASVAIGLALNPKLRVLLIRDGSLLDADSLKMISDMATAQDAQLWIERVEEGGATVVIEDGSVVGAATEAGAES